MYHLSKFIVISTCVLTVALTACSSLPAPSMAPSQTSVDAVNTNTSMIKTMIHIKTTSDWTNLRLVSGGAWVNPTHVSSSPEATSATIEGNLFSLSQPLERAEANLEVETTFNVFLSNLVPGDNVVFEIQRGFIGSTQVEISTDTGGQPSLLNTFTWDKTNPDNGNILEVQILSDHILTPPTAMPKPNEYITVAQLNLWFHGPGCYGGYEAFNCSGKRNTNLTPLLGAAYDSASADVIRQQIEWAATYGVDAFSIEWTTPREIPGSIENVLDDNFLKAPNLNKVRWCIFYDLVLRIQQTPGLKVDLSRGMDFDNPDVYNTFVADFEHFSQKYFNQPQYLKIDGRPVVYIWGTWNATGRYAEAFQEARQKAAQRGFDVYIVGDIIRTDHFYPKLAAAYDATTNFLFFMSGSAATKDVGEAAVGLDKTLTEWEQKIADIKVTGKDDMVILQPGFAPQFDNRQFIEVNGGGTSIYVPALSKDQVTAMAEVVRKHAHPVGSQGWKLIWLNTWNNWAETTTFEPTVADGPRYPASNYQFDMVEVIRDVFGAEVFSE